MLHIQKVLGKILVPETPVLTEIFIVFLSPFKQML